MNKKDMIVEIAADIIHKYGYNNIGIKQILDEANIPKGSFYHYFKSKEDLAISVIDYHIKLTKMTFDNCEYNLEGLRKFFAFYFNKYNEFNYCRGCAIGNLILELADIKESFREKLYEWIELVETEIYKRLENSNINMDKKIAASMLVSYFEGVILKVKVEKNPKSLEEFNYFVFDLLLKEE